MALVLMTAPTARGGGRKSSATSPPVTWTASSSWVRTASDPLPRRLDARPGPGRRERSSLDDAHGELRRLAEPDWCEAGRASPACERADGRSRPSTAPWTSPRPSTDWTATTMRSRMRGGPSTAALEAPGESPPGTAAQAMSTLLERRPDLDAVFVASDSMAIAAMQVHQGVRAARPRGRRGHRLRRFAHRPGVSPDPSPPSASRSRTWAARWSACCCSRSTGRDRRRSRSCSRTELVLRGSTGQGPVDPAAVPSSTVPA